MNKIIHWDCTAEMRKIESWTIDMSIIDPPYNVWYKYSSYKDNMSHEDYIYWQIWVIDDIWCLLKKWWSLIYITYPELWAELYTELIYWGYSVAPVDIWTWVYNTNLWWKYLRKASRMVLRLSNDEPCKNEVKWEYKNPKDKRIKKRIAKWLKPKSVDRFYIDQVKNVSKKHSHPCELPQELLVKFIDWLSDEWDTVLDCFAGSGSTWIACKALWRKYVLIEKEKEYIEIIKARL